MKRLLLATSASIVLCQPVSEQVWASQINNQPNPQTAQTMGSVCAGRSDISEEGASALKIATFFSQKEKVKTLLFDKCVAFDQNEKKPGGNPIAFFSKDPETFNYFLNRGFNPASTEVNDPKRKNILMFRIEMADRMTGANKPTAGSVPTEELKKIKAKTGLDFQSLSERDLNSASDNDLTRALLTQLPADLLSKTDGDRNNTLHYAIQYQRPEWVKIILSRNKDTVDQLNRYGLTPIDLIWKAPCGSAKVKKETAATVLEATPPEVLNKKHSVRVWEYISLSPANYAVLLKDLAPTTSSLVKAKLTNQDWSSAEAEIERYKRVYPTKLLEIQNRLMNNTDEGVCN